MDRTNIDKIGKTPEDKLLLAKLWDKINNGLRKNILSYTCFLTPRELEMARYLFGESQDIISFGGYEDAERKMLIYVPDYLDASVLYSDESPVVCFQTNIYHGMQLSHRDFLGALMGAGIARETVGDICVGNDSCCFFVTPEITRYIQDSFSEVGQTKVRISQIPLSEAVIPAPEFKEIRDTLASLRLDSVISSGFRIGRGLAAQYITSGKAAVDGLPCEKPDKPITEGARVSVRGLGKIKLQQINGTTKKDRISVTIHRYV